MAKKKKKAQALKWLVYSKGCSESIQHLSTKALGHSHGDCPPGPRHRAWASQPCFPGVSAPAILRISDLVCFSCPSPASVSGAGQAPLLVKHKCYPKFKNLHPKHPSPQSWSSRREFLKLKISWILSLQLLHFPDEQTEAGGGGGWWLTSLSPCDHHQGSCPLDSLTPHIPDTSQNPTTSHRLHSRQPGR